MIYHILNDEKFSDWVISSFIELDPNINRFIVVSDHLKAQYIEDNAVQFFTKDEFISDFRPHPQDLVLFYFLHIHNITYIRKNPSVCRYLWVGYGADYYYYLLDKRHFGSLYLAETHKVRKSLTKGKGIRRVFLPTYQWLFFHFKVKPALKNIEFFSPILPNEYDVIRNEHPYLKFKLVSFTFGDIEYLLNIDELTMTTNGSKILIGNSGTFANNHIDVLKIIKECGVGNQIVVPMSYGDNSYMAVLRDFCTSTFGSQVELLENFLPRHQYFDILRQCEYVIMGHLRQQGMGNIYACLYMGAKLFLFKKNPAFKFLRSHGVIVFEIDELKRHPDHLKTPLSESDKSHNREFIELYYSKSAVLERIKRILSL